jgi:hypothetical protein
VFIHFVPVTPLVSTTAMAPGCAALPVRIKPMVLGWSK